MRARKQQQFGTLTNRLLKAQKKNSKGPERVGCSEVWNGLFLKVYGRSKTEVIGTIDILKIRTLKEEKN